MGLFDKIGIAKSNVDKTGLNTERRGNKQYAGGEYIGQINENGECVGSEILYDTDPEKKYRTKIRKNS